MHCWLRAKRSSVTPLPLYEGSSPSPGPGGERSAQEPEELGVEPRNGGHGAVHTVALAPHGAHRCRRLGPEKSEHRGAALPARTGSNGEGGPNSCMLT